MDAIDVVKKYKAKALGMVESNHYHVVRDRESGLEISENYWLGRWALAAEFAKLSGATDAEISAATSRGTNAAMSESYAKEQS